MSLETLLEAAKYLEYRSEVKARGEEPHDYYTFSKLCSINSSNVTGIPSSQQSNSHKNLQPSNSPAHSTEEVKERRRAGSSTSRDSLLSHEHGGSGTREVHNKLEKNRRAHLKECFEALKKQLPNMDERKTSNLSILRGALRYIQILKRKEREHEHDLEKLAREKIAFQQQLASLKKDLSSQYDHIDLNALISVEDNETTTTASECGAISDLDEEFHNEVSSVSNHNSRLASDDTNSLSSSNAIGGASRTSVAAVGNNTLPQVQVSPKQTSLNTIFPSNMKGNVAKGTPTFTSDMLSPVLAKNIPRCSASDVHGFQLDTTADSNNSHTTRLIPASSLQTMAGIISSPHAVQVITPPSSIKLLTAANSVPPANVQPFPVSHHQHGQIHVLASSSVPYVTSPVTTSGSKLATSDQLVQCADLPMQPKQQALSPMALVSSQAFVGITQVATTAKPVIVNQVSNVSELMTSGASSSLANQVLPKLSLSSQVLGTNMALTVKNSPPSHNIADASSNASQSIINTSLHAVKSSQQIIQPSCTSQQTVSGLIPSEGLQINNINRQVGASRPHPASSPACNILSHCSGMSQLAQQSPITVPASHLVAPGNMSGVTPLVGSVSVVSHTGALHHHQILAQSQPIGKVIASPILKSINQIPIIQQQFLQAPGSMSNQHLVKPVVVVSMPNIIHSGNISPLTSRHVLSANEQPDAVCNPISGSQK